MADEGRTVDERVRRIEEGLVLHPETRSSGLRQPPIADRMETMNVPGVSVAVVNEGVLEWARGYGVREAGQPDRVTTETLFRCCSISKMVAALGALRLVAEGRLRLDDDVNDHLRSWKVPKTGDWQPRVTLRHLLSHTAGISLHGGAGGYPRDAECPTLLQVLNGERPSLTAAVTVSMLPGGRRLPGPTRLPRPTSPSSSGRKRPGGGCSCFGRVAASGGLCGAPTEGQPLGSRACYSRRDAAELLRPEQKGPPLRRDGPRVSGGCGFGRRSRRGGSHAELLLQARDVLLPPVLHHLAFREPDDVDALNRHSFPTRRDAHDLALLRALPRGPDHDLVAFRDHVVDRHAEVGKRGADLLEALLQAFPARPLHGARIMLHKVGGDQLVNDRGVPLVEELVDKTAGQRLVRLTR